VSLPRLYVWRVTGSRHPGRIRLGQPSRGWKAMALSQFAQAVSTKGEADEGGDIHS